MPTSSDPTETADIGDLEQRHTAQANHLERLARMAAPFGYSLVDDVALEHLRAETFAARTMRQAIDRLRGVTAADPKEVQDLVVQLLFASATLGQPDPPAAA